MILRPVLLTALLPVVLAYSNTAPIVAWSSHSSKALSFTSDISYTNAFLESLIYNNDICEHDAVVLVDHMGLHATDLRSLSPSSHLVQTLKGAPSSLELPYMRRSAGNPFVDLAGAISRRCGSRVLSVSAGEVKPHLEEQTEKKHVMCIGMPPLDGTSGYRKYLMSEHESQLSSDMNHIAAAFPKYLVVYAGWAPSLESRQFYEDGELSPFDLSITPETLVFPSKAAATEGGILKRYQLLTPGLIITLLVVFFVLVPLVFMGISSLASIQSSVRLDTPKGYNAVEKKTQ